MKKAVFLDRDGVLNELIYNEKNSEYEPPHRTEDIKFFDNVAESLKQLKDGGFELFIISNQPDYAKGKTSLENLQKVRNRFMELLNEREKIITEDFYCFHHPQGTVKEYSFDCECRKPKTLFIDKAAGKYDLDREKSWMTGDRETDIKCGSNASLNTILIKNKYNDYTDSVKADFTAGNLSEAVKIILNKK
ncbi:MAG: HAD-IIIA family hydrolase [Bacteroidetes bacterium]|nr:HAD-IIIA family hydrolase [Bacteroidota bacterium]